jgi:ribosomal protein S14
VGLTLASIRGAAGPAATEPRRQASSDQATQADTHIGSGTSCIRTLAHTTRMLKLCRAQLREHEAMCDEWVGAAPQLGQRFSGGGKESPEYARGNYLLRTLGMQAGPRRNPALSGVWYRC